MAPFTGHVKPITFADLLERNKTAEPILYGSEYQRNFVMPKVVIFCCIDFRVQPEEFLGIEKGEALIFRNVGGNVEQHLNDLLVLETRLNYGLKELIVIHHEDCGTTFVTPEMIKDETKARLPDYAREIDDLQFQMHNTNNLEESVRRDLRFLRECPYIRKELGENSKGFVFYLKTNKLVPVD
ncbi:carbonic anhydrase [Xylogone sp. PMI_703]|nr:carbonic anhydrase [Xylogone sp. PMI_703]